jgi:hypothetical protein
MIDNRSDCIYCAELVCKLRNRMICGTTLAIEIIVEAESTFTKYSQNYGYPRFTPVGRITRARVALVCNDYADFCRWWLSWRRGDRGTRGLRSVIFS